MKFLVATFGLISFVHFGFGVELLKPFAAYAASENYILFDPKAFQNATGFLKKIAKQL